MIIKVKLIINYYIHKFENQKQFWFHSMSAHQTTRTGIWFIPLFTKQLGSGFKFHTQPSRIQVLIPFHSSFITKQALKAFSLLDPNFNFKCMSCLSKFILWNLYFFHFFNQLISNFDHVIKYSSSWIYPTAYNLFIKII